jgi:phosphate transport system substrate-binding protein
MKSPRGKKAPKLFLVLVAAVSLSLAPSLAPAQPGQAVSGNLVIEGTGDSQELLRALAERFTAQNPEANIEVPNGIGSRGGIIALLERRVAMARVSRPLNQNEKRSWLVYEVFAKCPVVFAISPEVRLRDLRSKQLTGIYSGEYVNWKQLGGTASRIYPVGRESTDPSRAVLNRLLPGFRNISNPASKTYYTTSALVEAVEKHPGAIGYAPMAMVRKARLKVLKVDGVYPLVTNVRNGRYRMVIPLGIVHGDELSPLARAFTEFLHDKVAENTIIQYGCVPARR